MFPQCWLRTWRYVLLLASLLPQAAWAAGPEPRADLESRLTPAVRGSLAEAARDPGLKPWQRELMQEYARSSSVSGSSERWPAGPFASERIQQATAVDGTWNVMPPPSSRWAPVTIYDPVRARLLVFGGWDNGVMFSDVWALNLSGGPIWTPLSPTGTPPVARFALSAIYDPLRDRIVLYGGDSGIVQGDVWELTLPGTPAWNALAPTGSPPPERWGHTAIYDPLRDRMVVFGGRDNLDADRNDVWALSLSGSPAWTQLAPTGTPAGPRTLHTAIYDPVRDRLITYGGLGPGNIRQSDTWTLSLSGTPSWTELATSGNPPAPFFAHAAVYDPVRDRMLVIAGNTVGGPTNVARALSLSGTPTWIDLAPAGALPPERDGHGTIYDPVGDRLVTFAGVGLDNQQRNDLWALTLSGSPAWSEITTSGSPRRWGHAAIYDPLRDRIVVFGGEDVVANSDVWAFSLGSPSWSLLTPLGTPPSPRTYPSAIYDPVGDRMVVFGGTSSTELNDVWVLPFTGTLTWGQLSPAGTPPSGRSSHSAIYDPIRHRMLVFGGRDGGASHNDAWVLSLSVGTESWSEVIPAGSPPPERWGHSAIYDPVRDRMVAYGGRDAGGPLNDLWAMSLAGSPAWSQLAPTGAPPSARAYHSAIYDPLRDRMVVFGGWPTLLNDVWALKLSGAPAWSALSPFGPAPTARMHHTVFHDSGRDRMTVYGGLANSGALNDVRTLTWNGTTSVAGTADAGDRVELATPYPNPSRDVTNLLFRLGEPSRILLDVFDVHGRRVRRIADGWFPAGRHAYTWRGDDDRGGALGGGLYFVRLQGAGVEATRRIIRIH
jgi:hypothetical protein